MKPQHTDPRLLLLHPDDSVLILMETAQAGDALLIEGRSCPLPAALGMGHKLARRALAKGDTVLKYGAPIGLAGCDIAQGAHVHIHNLVSRYTVIEDMEKSR